MPQKTPILSPQMNANVMAIMHEDPEKDFKLNEPRLPSISRKGRSVPRTTWKLSSITCWAFIGKAANSMAAKTIDDFFI